MTRPFLYHPHRTTRFAIAIIFGLLAGCGGAPQNPVFETKPAQVASPDALGINAFLWRATLDTLRFLPLKSADPFGGIVITDWYSDATTPNERLRVIVYILDRRLRADALRLSLFREQKRKGDWVAATADPQIVLALESTILRRARDLKLNYIR